MNSTAGIKADKLTAGVAKIIRGYEEISISEIKRRIDNNEYLYVCDFIDEKGVSSILNMYEQLTAQGVGCTLYDHDNPADMSFLRNWAESCKGVAADTELDMDREAEE